MAGTSSKRDEITLCLSGGGFRATFFRLGVVRFLRDEGHLRNVTRIYTVSGGSILGAHMALHWDDYSDRSRDREFQDRAKEIINFAQLNVRQRIVRRSVLRGWTGRAKLLESQYTELFKGAELGHLPASPLFPPVRIARHMTNSPAGSFQVSAHWLTDGGVFDNLGLFACRWTGDDQSATPHSSKNIPPEGASQKHGKSGRLPSRNGRRYTIEGSTIGSIHESSSLRWVLSKGVRPTL